MFSTTNPQEHKPTADELVEVLRAAGRGQRSASETAKLADLDRASSRQVWLQWQLLPVDARRYLTREMLELAETNLDFNFFRVLRLLIDDEDPEVRALAVAGLWEDESTALLDQFLALLATEPEPVVREALAEALGRFSYRASLDELDDARSERLRESLLDLALSEEPIGVRRRALESVAYFDDDDVASLIDEAYESIHHDLRASALFAMGRNLSDRWYGLILENLDEEDPELRFEAARASGEYGDTRAVDQLLSLVGDEDREVQFAALTALGQIGGKMAVQALRRVARSDDTVLAEFAEEALSQAEQVVDPLRRQP